jgi:hypothetical protein
MRAPVCGDFARRHAFDSRARVAPPQAANGNASAVLLGRSLLRVARSACNGQGAFKVTNQHPERGARFCRRHARHGVPSPSLFAARSSSWRYCSFHESNVIVCAHDAVSGLIQKPTSFAVRNVVDVSVMRSTKF